MSAGSQGALDQPSLLLYDPDGWKSPAGGFYTLNAGDGLESTQH
jgi:hypothetical protein